MASYLNPAYAYTVVYVKDVAKSVEFYGKAFGASVRRLDDSHRWGELESGQTTIAFTPVHQHETDDLTGEVQEQKSKGRRNQLEVCFAYADVDVAYKSAVEKGGRGGEPAGGERVGEEGRVRSRTGGEVVSQPEEKEWGKKVGYVRDIDGIVVRMGSHVKSQR